MTWMACLTTSGNRLQAQFSLNLEKNINYTRNDSKHYQADFILQREWVMGC